MRPAKPPARILVNDRLDVALAAGAAGVHLGGESAPAGEVVRWLRSGNAPADFLVGVSCHSLEEVLAAENTGASYAFFGPVFDSPGEKSFRSTARRRTPRRSLPFRENTCDRDWRGESRKRRGMFARGGIRNRRDSTFSAGSVDDKRTR